MKGRPAAWVGFAHDSETGHAVLEAFVAVSSPFAAHPRASYLGKAPGTLDAIIGRSFDLTRVADAITAAYQAAWGARLTVEDPDVVADDVAALHEDAPPASVAEGWLLDPPWSASVDEAIGVVAAGRDRHGRLCVGGDLLASRDAIARLEARIDGASPDAVQAIVQEVLGDPRVAIDGVRDLTNVGDVIVRALTAPG